METTRDENPPTIAMSTSRSAMARGRAAAIILVFAMVGAALGTWAVLTQKPRYESTASVYATSLNTNLRALADEVTAGALTGSLGGTQQYYIMALLQSTACRLAVADALHLDRDPVFWGDSDEPHDERSLDVLLRRLNSMITVTQKEGLIKIAARSPSAEMSQRIAQACLDFLDKRVTLDNRAKSGTLAKQVAGVREKLRKAEKALRDFMTTHEFVPQEEREKAEITALLELHRQLAFQEVELTGTQSQLDAPGDLARQIELKSLEAGTQARVDKLREMVQVREARLKALPDALLEYQRRVRDVKINEKVLLVMNEQYSLALFQEAGRVLPYKVVDVPRVPTLPTSRYGMLKVTLAAVMFGLLGYALTHYSARAASRAQAR